MKIITINHTQFCFVVLCLLTPLQLLSAEVINQADTNALEQNRQQERLRLLKQQQEIKPDVREAAEKLQSVIRFLSLKHHALLFIKLSWLETPLVNFNLP